MTQPPSPLAARSGGRRGAGGLVVERLNDLSPLASLREPRFRALVTIQLANAIGVWMHIVAAQWLLTQAGRPASQVAAVPAAMSIPFLLLCLPVGALAGRIPAARMMTSAAVVSALASGAAATLAVLRPENMIALLATVLLIGSGLVALAVAWQAQIPRLVEPDSVASAAMVDGAAFNLARALGPVAAGAGLALAGSAATFAVTAVLFGICAVALAVATPRSKAAKLPSESLGRSIGAGLRFARHSPWTRRLLTRLCLFGVPSAALWSLLPLVAHDRLGLDSRGFGLLFGVVGVGAVAGTLLLAPLRARMSVNAFGFAGSLAFAAMLFGLATVPDVASVALLLVVGGASWVGVQTTWMTAAHQALPEWVRARIVALILLLFQGCQAAGALLWGRAADLVGYSWALAAAACCMTLAGAGFLRHGLYPSRGIEPWPVPTALAQWDLDLDPSLAVRVEVSYRPRSGQEKAFGDAIAALRLSRLRVGARGWELLVDPDDPTTYVESIPFASWADYMAAETVRLTVPELRLRERVMPLLTAPPGQRVLVRATSSALPTQPRPRRGAR